MNTGVHLLLSSLLWVISIISTDRLLMSLQAVSLQPCNTTIEFEDNKLKIEWVHNNSLNTYPYTFILYLAEENYTKCQWTEIHQQYISSSRDFSIMALHQTKIRSTFNHISSGGYCFAIYDQKWTSSFPLCNSVSPFYLGAERLEDVKFWNPILIAHQTNYNELSIQLTINESDIGLKFQDFEINVYKVVEVMHRDIDICHQNSYLTHKLSFQMYIIFKNVADLEMVVNDLEEGFYCIRVTPMDQRCQVNHSTTHLPCTRSSKLIQITYYRNIPWAFIGIGLAFSFLFLCSALTYCCWKYKNRKSKKLYYEENVRTEEILLNSIFLLHSAEPQLEDSIQKFKIKLLESLPSLSIQDFTEEDQWESFIQNGFSQFWSHLNKDGKFIIILKPFQDSKANPFFLKGLQHLEYIASLPSNHRVLVVWLSSITEEQKHPTYQQFESVFYHYYLPRDWNIFINKIQLTS